MLEVLHLLAGLGEALDPPRRAGGSLENEWMSVRVAGRSLPQARLIAPSISGYMLICQ